MQCTVQCKVYRFHCFSHRQKPNNNFNLYLQNKNLTLHKGDNYLQFYQYTFLLSKQEHHVSEGDGRSIFWKTRDRGLPSFSNNLSTPVPDNISPPTFEDLLYVSLSIFCVKKHIKFLSNIMMNQYDDIVSSRRMNKPKQNTYFAHFSYFIC